MREQISFIIASVFVTLGFGWVSLWVASKTVSVLSVDLLS